jgi:hypothetical protein
LHQHADSRRDRAIAPQCTLQPADFLRAGQRSTDHGNDGDYVERFGQVAESANLHGALDIGFVVIGREKQKGHACLIAQTARQFKAIEVRHADVEHCQIRRLALAQHECLHAVTCLDNLETGLPQAFSQREQDQAIIIGDENFCHISYFLFGLRLRPRAQSGTSLPV